MSAALVSPFSDFNDVLFQQRKARSQSVSMLGMNMERQLSLSILESQQRTRHGSTGSSSNMMLNCGSMSPPTPTTVAMISLGDFNRSAGVGPVHSMNSYSHFDQNNHFDQNTANNTNVPTARKLLDRSVSEPCDRNAKNAGGNVNSARYKTELCRPYEENGYCKYGDKCQFAHGNNEQRSLARHPKYKTELCRTFHTIGFCPYGPRCHFIHNEDERRLHQIIQMKQQQLAAQAALHQAAAAQNTLQQLQQQVQMQSTSPVNMPSHSLSSPNAVQRPRTLNLTLSMVRDSLGSTADSPPSSFTDSPSISPNYLAEDLLAVSMALCNTPPASAPAAVSSAFTFPEMGRCQPIASTPTPIMTPLNVQTDPLASLAAGLQAASLRNQAMLTNEALRELNELYTPPSPPDSLNGDSIMQAPCETALDLSRGLRLPIFSRMSN